MAAYLREPVLVVAVAGDTGDGDTDGGDKDGNNDKSDPLAWWKNNAVRFPLLSVLAKKYLCVCATSTASERVFSTAGNVVTSTRNLLKPEKVDMLVFLAKNLK